MSSPYVGEIRMFGGNFAPVGWAFCSGQLMPISENETLFNLIGTTYGGDGQETFALPNLQSRVPMHAGTNAGITYQLGEMAGTESVTLTVNQIPVHSHPVTAVSTPGNTSVKSPTNNLVADQVNVQTPNPLVSAYVAGSDANLKSLAPNALQVSGGSQPHDNMLPFLCVNFIISLFGIFPSQT
jgi:microcystin-dependent protein